MRLLFVSHSLPPADRPLDNVGGMQRAAIDLHDSLLSNSSVTAKALVLRSSWDERALRTPLFLAKALGEIRRQAQAREIDAVLFSSMVTGALTIPLRHVLRRNSVISAVIVNGLDATTPTWPYPLLVRRIFQCADVALPISRATEAEAVARGLDTAKSKVISLGVRAERFDRSVTKELGRRRLVEMIASANATVPKMILCSVGRLVPRKGVQWFVQNVMPLLPADVHLVVAGDGPDRSRIDAAILSTGMSDRITMLGRVSEDDLETVYLGSDLFMMPNVPVEGDIEGFGLVMLEAGIFGLPVIAADMEGIRDVITNGENGHRLPSGDSSAWVAQVMKYYDDVRLLSAASERAREYTTREFGWERATDHIIGILSALSVNNGN